jgi:hypothetical protein
MEVNELNKYGYDLVSWIELRQNSVVLDVINGQVESWQPRQQ